MPKVKTKRGAAKRFKLTGTGKVKRSRAYLRHQLSCKSPTQKRRLRKSTTLTGGDARTVKRLLPNHN